VSEAGWCRPRAKGDEHVSNLSGGPAHSAEQLTIQHYPRSNARSDGQEDEVFGPNGCTRPALSECRKVYIVIHHRRYSEGAFQKISQRNISPAEEVRRRNHDAGVHIGYPRRSCGNCAQRAARYSGFLKKFSYAITNQLNDSISTSTIVGRGGPPGNDVTICICKSETKVRPAYVNSNNKAISGGDMLPLQWCSRIGRFRGHCCGRSLEPLNISDFARPLLPRVLR
jgi:hypothetical protein